MSISRSQQVRDLSKATGITQKVLMPIIIEYHNLLGKYVMDQKEVVFPGFASIHYKPFKANVHNNFGGVCKSLGIFIGKTPKLLLHRDFRMAYRKKTYTVEEV